MLLLQEPHIGCIGQRCEGLSEEQQRFLQFYDPGQISDSKELTVNNDTIGFFIAKFKKKWYFCINSVFMLLYFKL